MNRFRGMQIKSIELVESGPTKIQDAATLTKSLQYTSESVCACTVYIRHVTYTFCISTTVNLVHQYMHRFLFGTFEFTNIPCQPCLARKACRTCGETLAGYFPACKCLLAAVVGGCSGRALDILENSYASICIFEVPLVPKLGAVHSH